MPNPRRLLRPRLFCTIGTALTLALGGCRTYAYLLGYPQAPKPARYRYYDPSFAAHNAALLARSQLKVKGFYYRPGGVRLATGPLTNPPLSPAYLKFAADGSFLLVFADVAPGAIDELLLRADPSGYYQLAGDTVWLQARAPTLSWAGTNRLVVGYARLYPDSIQVYLPERVAPQARWFRYYHQP